MKLPIFRKLIAEDFADQKGWIDKLLYPLNDFFTTVYTTLNKGITFNENCNASINKVSFKGGDTITLKNPLPKNQVPAGILMINIQEDNNEPNVLTQVTSIYWYYDYDNNFIKILVNGVVPVTKYKANFLIIGG